MWEGCCRGQQPGDPGDGWQAWVGAPGERVLTAGASHVFPTPSIHGPVPEVLPKDHVHQSLRLFLLKTLSWFFIFPPLKGFQGQRIECGPAVGQPSGQLSTSGQQTLFHLPRPALVHLSWASSARLCTLVEALATTWPEPSRSRGLAKHRLWLSYCPASCLQGARTSPPQTYLLETAQGGSENQILT